jgi:hypothetical protein
MASLSSFTITVNLSGTVANPVNSLNFQVVAPWGKSAVRSSLDEAMRDVMDRCGNAQAGRIGSYFLNQTTNSTEVGIP